MGAVLILDDDPVVSAALAYSLGTGDYQAFLAGTISEARELLAGNDVQVMLLDVELDGESGLDYAAELRATHPFLPVVIVSAHDDRETWMLALERGARGFLPKPVGGATLLAAIENAIRRAELERAAASAMATLEDAVAARTSELEDALASLEAAHSETVLMLAHAAEWRDIDTGTHLARMSGICGLLGAELGLASEECSILREASTLHDVGKIAIPDAVLLKPGPLTETEVALMQTHTVIGYDLLSKAESALLQVAATIALTHHERFDGTGYPRGLAGTDIPLFGRIAAVADTYDAITSDRPYRAARPAEEAYRILAEERGRQFDPEVVDAFGRLSFLEWSSGRIRGRPDSLAS